jgi:hypothetical protein
MKWNVYIVVVGFLCLVVKKLLCVWVIWQTEKRSVECDTVEVLLCQIWVELETQANVFPLS